MNKVLFVCVHNSGRSQMACALVEHSGAQALTAESAGTMPGKEVDTVVKQVMKEIGIDIGGSRPQLITQDMVDNADQVITMGCSIDESCPANFIVSEDWGLDDPKGKHIDEVRRIRDEISLKVAELIGRL
jgi:arsenate reductase